MEGAELRRIRKLNGKTQEYVAERMGVTKAAVSRIEGRDDVRDDTVARYLGAMLGFAEVVVIQTIVYQTDAGAPIYHEKATTKITVKVEGDPDD